jgi:MFS family permease
VLLSYWRVLRRNPSYARLWLADAISLVGDWFSLIALSVLVSRYSGGDGLAISGLLLAQLLPMVLIGPFAGVLVDRLDRKWILIISDLLRLAITLGFLLVRSADMLWLVYLLTVAQFTISSIFEPARSAMMPRVVPPEDLVTANVLSSITWSAMLALGGLLGGLVAGFFGVETALLINSLSFLLSAVLLLGVQPTAGGSFRPERTNSGEAQGGGLLDGLLYLRERPATAALLMLKAGSAVSSIETVRALYATSIFAGNDQGAWALGMLSAAAGVGAVLGPVLLERFNNGSIGRMRRLSLVGLAACSVGILILAQVQGLWAAALVFVLRAMGGSVVWTYSAVMIQQSTEDYVRGRVFALDYAANMFTAVCSTLILGCCYAHPTRRYCAPQLGLTTLVPLALWGLALVLIERSERRAVPAPL